MNKNIVTGLLFCILSLTTQAQDVHIPDSNFRNALLALTSLNTNGDDEIQVTEAEAFTGTLYMGGKNIYDMTGIEAFVNLKVLSCFNNKLTSLDISKNIELRELRCYLNQINSLDLSKNINLEELSCHRNSFTTLDVTKNVKLKSLSCYSTAISSIDISNNPALEELNISYTGITSLSIPNPAKLKELDISGLDSLPQPDLSTMINLEEYGCRSLELTSLDVSMLTKLKVLSCGYNNLTSLDVSMLKDLYRITCNSNDIEVLDLTGLANLNHVNLSGNKLSNIDLTAAAALRYLYLSDNELERLNIANGGNENLITFQAIRNPDLTCINVDRKSYADSNWTNIDSTASFSESCSYVSVTNEVKNVAMYPNPCANILSSDQFIHQDLYIFNALGERMLAVENADRQIDISALPSGIYFITIMSETDKLTAKFTKL